MNRLELTSLGPTPDSIRIQSHIHSATPGWVAIQHICFLVLLLWILVLNTPNVSAQPQPTRKETKSSGQLTAVVLPYQSVFQAARPDQTQLITRLIRAELKRTQGWIIKNSVTVEAQRSQQAEHQPTSAHLLSKKTDANRHERHKNIQAAIQARRDIVTILGQSPSLIHQASQWLMAHHYLARVLFWGGEDEAAKEVLRLVTGVTPMVQLSPREFSLFYRQTFKSLYETASHTQPAEITIRTTPPNLEIDIDGTHIARTPIKLEGLRPGLHLVQTQSSSSENISSSLNAKAHLTSYSSTHIIRLHQGKNDDINLKVSQESDLGNFPKIITAINKNHLSLGAIQEAIEFGRMTQAELVIMGAISKPSDTSHLNLHTFIIHTSNPALLTTPPIQSDPELLSARLNASSIVQAILKNQLNLKNQPQLKPINIIDPKASLPNSIPVVRTQSTNRPPSTTQASPTRRRPIRTPISAPPKIKDRP